MYFLLVMSQLRKIHYMEPESFVLYYLPPYKSLYEVSWTFVSLFINFRGVGHMNSDTTSLSFLLRESGYI
jgi:hypothetical protein